MLDCPRERNLVALMREVREILNGLNIEFWLDTGTLLGAVRDGEVIPWEYDVDLGAWKNSITKDKKKLLVKQLEQAGFDVGVYDTNINVRKAGEERFWLDINFFSFNNNYAILPKLFPSNIIGRILSSLIYIFTAPLHCLVFKEKPFVKRLVHRTLITIARLTPPFLRILLVRTGTAVYKKIGSKDVSWVVPNHYFSNLSTVTFYGMEFKVPAEIEAYVAFRYGEDWRTPKKDWLTEKDDGAVAH